MYTKLWWFNQSSPGGRPKTVELDDKAVAEFKQIPGVVAATPIVQAYGTIINGRYISETLLKVLTQKPWSSLSLMIKEGRLLQPGDDLVVVFGGSMEYQFYDYKAMQRGRWVEPKSI